eukprot:GHVU01103497.1.p1 GENE.GHVU01103497.1~~GHVU01103497.1.p1  ORF type:complete len:249 (-),score=59.78 GHVU01103497.1:148-894(-)
MPLNTAYYSELEAVANAPPLTTGQGVPSLPKGFFDDPSKDAVARGEEDPEKRRLRELGTEFRRYEVELSMERDMEAAAENIVEERKREEEFGEMQFAQEEFAQRMAEATRGLREKRANVAFGGSGAGRASATATTSSLVSLGGVKKKTGKGFADLLSFEEASADPPSGRMLHLGAGGGAEGGATTGDGRNQGHVRELIEEEARANEAERASNDDNDEDDDDDDIDVVSFSWRDKSAKGRRGHRPKQHS